VKAQGPRASLFRRPSFWLIVVLVIVIPTVTFFSTQMLLRVLRPPAHSSGSSVRADARSSTGNQTAPPRTFIA